MSKKKCTDGRKNNRPPQNRQFGQPDGNPINKKGAPRKEDRMQRFSMDSFRSFIMNEAWKEVEIKSAGSTKRVPKFYLIVSQLYTKAAQGDFQSTKLVTQLLKSAATGNDKDLYEWISLWGDMQERKLRASGNPGSPEHYQVMYEYFMFKRDIRRIEGVEAWPYENEEPKDDDDWRVFIKHHDRLKKDPEYRQAPWPPQYPSDGHNE